MPRLCAICTHVDAERIDTAVVEGKASLRKISQEFKISPDSLYRHKRNHLPQKLIKAKEAREVIKADNNIDRLKALQAEAQEILEEAKRSRTLHIALEAIRELSRLIELQAKLAGELRQQIDLYIHPDYVKMRTIILQVLEPHPQIRTKIARPSRMLLDVAQGLDPVLFAEKSLQFEPDEKQKKILRSASKRLILNCCRQFGKSTLGAILALHRAVYFPRSLILLLSPSLRQSQELFRKVSQMVRVTKTMPKLVEDSKLFLALANKSRIISLPGREGTVRGYSEASLIIIDEAAQVEDELYMAIRPTLAVSGGTLVLLSTPRGKRGHFFHVWTEGTGWEKHQVVAEQCSRIPKEFLEEEKRALGELWFSQEYEGAFVELEGMLFNLEDILSAFSRDVSPFQESPISAEVEVFQ